MNYLCLFATTQLLGTGSHMTTINVKKAYIQTSHHTNMP